MNTYISGRRWRRRGGRCEGALDPDAAADHHTAEEDDDRDDGGRHEQEHELFPVELNLVKGVVVSMNSHAEWKCTMPLARVPAPSAKGDIQRGASLWRRAIAVTFAESRARARFASSIADASSAASR